MYQNNRPNPLNKHRSNTKSIRLFSYRKGDSPPYLRTLLNHLLHGNNAFSLFV